MLVGVLLAVAFSLSAIVPGWPSPGQGVSSSNSLGILQALARRDLEHDRASLVAAGEDLR